MNFQEVVSHVRSLRPSVIRQHPMLGDPISVMALSAAVALNVVTLVLLVLKVHKVDYPVPTHYLNLVGFDQVGAWYSAYRLPVYGLLVTAINGLLAGKSFQRNRLVSFFLLLGAVAVGLLCLVIGLAFGAIV